MQEDVNREAEPGDGHTATAVSQGEVALKSNRRRLALLTGLLGAVLVVLIVVLFG